MTKIIEQFGDFDVFLPEPVLPTLAPSPAELLYKASVDEDDIIKPEVVKVTEALYKASGIHVMRVNGNMRKGEYVHPVYGDLVDYPLFCAFDSDTNTIVIRGDMSDAEAFRRLDKFNEYHDEMGRFTSEGGGGSASEEEADATKWDGKTNTDVFWKEHGGGEYPLERQGMHNDAVQHFEDKPKAEGKPLLDIIAGGTASGKGQFAKESEGTAKSDRYGIKPPSVTPALANTDEARTYMPETKQLLGTNTLGLTHGEAGEMRDMILRTAAGRKNNIVLDTPGSSTLVTQADAMERKGYQVRYTYIHRPVEESIALEKHRSENPTSPTDNRKVPEDITRLSHVKARTAFSDFVTKPNREIKVYDGTGKAQGEPYNLVYHRLADGTVVKFDKDAMHRMAVSEHPPMTGF
jgi:hypothetical protein